MRFKLLACEILYREICAVVARSPHRVDVQFMPKGLHDLGGDRMRFELRKTLSEIDASPYDAILLGYALCSNGIAELTAVDCPIIVPRAHDCITLFLGDKDRYLDYFHKNPGVYFKTTGWIERGDDLLQSASGNDLLGFSQGTTHEDLVEQYGKEAADFLWEQFASMNGYQKLTFIEMGIEPDNRFEKATKELAEEKGWEFEKLTGRLELLQVLVNGDWDEERFLIVPPGHKIEPSFDESIIKAVPIDGDEEA
jgi:hypothetical protein